MLYWILSVICIVTLHSCVASKYYYKEDNGNYDVYYGPYPRWGYKEFRPPKSYKVGYEDRGRRPGKCIRGEFKCDSPYPTAKTKFFECELDYQCPRLFKCCQNHCFQHKICQPIDLETSDENNEAPTDASVIKTTSEVVTTQSSDSMQTTNSVSTSISTRGGITISSQQPTPAPTLESTITIKDKDIKQSTETSFTTTESPTTLNGIATKEIVTTTATTFKEATDDNNEIPIETSVKKTTTEVVSTQTTNSVSAQISTTTESPTTRNIITTKEIVSTTATVSMEDRPSSATFPYTTTSKTTQQSTSHRTQSPTTKRKETTTSKRLTSTAFPSTQHVSKSTTMVTNEDLQSTSIISTENSKTVDHRPPSSYTTISEPSTFQSSTTEIFETTTETYLPLDISSTPAEGTEIPKKVSTRHTLKPTTVIKNENSQFTTETPTESSTIIDKITNGKETSTTAVIVDEHTVTSTLSSFTTSTMTESPTSISTKFSATKTSEITIVPSSPTTTEEEETITQKGISTQDILQPTTVTENEHIRSTSVAPTEFDRITGENGKDAGTTKKGSSTISSDQNSQEVISEYTTITSSKVLATSQIPEMKTTKGKTTVTSKMSVSPTFTTQFSENSTTKYSNPTTLMSPQTTSVKYGTTEPTAESVISQKTTKFLTSTTSKILATPETTAVVETSSSVTSRPPQDKTNPTTKFITQTTKLLDTSPVSITYKPTLQPESTTTAHKTSESPFQSDITSDDEDLASSGDSEHESTINNESLNKSSTIVNVEVTTKTLDMLPDTSKQTRTSNEPAITSVVTIPDFTYSTSSTTVEPFNYTTSSTLGVTSSRLSSTSKTTSIQMTGKSAIATTTPHESTSKRVTKLSKPITDDEDLDFSGSGDNPDDILIQEKLTSTTVTDDFTFRNETSSRQEVPQSFLKSTYGREEATGKEFYDVSSTISTVISEATRISTQYISHSTLSTLKTSTAVKDSPKLPDKHITIALEESTATTPKYKKNVEELLSSTVTIPEELTTVTSKLDNSMNSAETSTKTSDGASERISTTHDYFNTTLEFKTNYPKSTAKVTTQPTSKSTDAENNNITSINTLLSSGSTPRATHVKDAETTTNDRTVTTFPISGYPNGNKIYMMDRLLGTFRKLPSVHEKAGDGGDNYNFNNFLGFLDKISDLLRMRNDTIYNDLDYQTTTVSEKSTSYKSGQGTTQTTTKDKLTTMKIIEVEN